MSRRQRLSLVALTCLALAFALLCTRDDAPAPDLVARPEQPAAEPAPLRRRTARPSTARIDDATTGRACAPSAAEQCAMGDVWLVDSCGTPEEKLEECDVRPCRDDACEPPPRAPCTEPPHGRCDGDTVRLCEAGRSVAIDCRAKGLRCAHGDEGAECLPEVPRALRCSGAARCEGDVLITCEAGKRTQTDCTSLHAKCLALSDADGPRCVDVQPAVPVQPGCGPCGCPPAADAAERTCDGRDEDADGHVDEELDCGSVPVIAFVVTSASGARSHAEEDIELELQRANQLFARSAVPGAPTFALDDVILLSAPSLLELDHDEFTRLATDPRIHPPRDGFYVPLVFTDRIISGETPKSGLSTLPNGTCGGLQEGAGPDVGLVAVAKARYETTVAHELGHFLGLCHTHDQQETVPFVAVADARTGALARCLPGCRGEGDGICDTPPDPGPERCSYEPGCTTSCGTLAAPDATNLMSYYTGCRDRFTAEQVRLMQHTLALRRGWHRCVDRACACELGDTDCPAGMSCRPVLVSGTEATRCALDGARPPAADCDGHAQCGRGAICLVERESGAQRCIRPCRAAVDGCDCTPVSESLSICIEDLRR